MRATILPGEKLIFDCDISCHMENTTDREYEVEVHVRRLRGVNTIYFSKDVWMPKGYSGGKYIPKTDKDLFGKMARKAFHEGALWLRSEHKIRFAKDVWGTDESAL